MTTYVVNPAHVHADDSNAGTAARPWETTAAITAFDAGPQFKPGDRIELYGRNLAPFVVDASSGSVEAPIVIAGMDRPSISNRIDAPVGPWNEVSPGLWQLDNALGGLTAAWVSIGGDVAVSAHGPNQGAITDRGVIVHQWVGGDLQFWTAPVGGVRPDKLGPIVFGRGDGIYVRRSHFEIRDIDGRYLDNVVALRAFISLMQVGVNVRGIYGERVGTVFTAANNAADANYTRASVIAECEGFNIGSSLIQLTNSTGGGNVIRANRGRRIGQIYSTGGIYLGGGTTNDDRDEFVFVIDNEIEECYTGNYFPGDGHGVELDNTVRKVVVARNIVRDSRRAEGGNDAACYKSNAGKFENYFIGNIGDGAERLFSFSDALGNGTRDILVAHNTGRNITDRGVSIAGPGGTIRVHNNAVEGVDGAAAFIRLISGAEGTVLEESGNTITGFAEAIDDSTSAGYTLDPSSQEVGSLELQRDYWPTVTSPCAFAGQDLDALIPLELGRVYGLAGDGVTDAVEFPAVGWNPGGFVIGLILTVFDDSPGAAQDLIALGGSHNESFRLQRMTNGRLRLYKRIGGSHVTELQTQEAFEDGDEVRVVFGFDAQLGSFMTANGVEDYVLASGQSDVQIPADMGLSSIWLFADANGNSSATDDAKGVRCLEYYMGIPDRDYALGLPLIPGVEGTTDVASVDRIPPRSMFGGDPEAAGLLIPPDWRGYER